MALALVISNGVCQAISAAVAAVTERVQLGTLVTPPFFRNPAVLAKQIATIDQIMEGHEPDPPEGWFITNEQPQQPPHP